MALTILIENWSSEAMAYVHELPGCFASGTSPDEALGRLPEAIAEHYAWLASRDISAPVETTDFEIAETLPPINTGYGPLFAIERQPITPGHVEHALAVAAAARDDVLNLYQSTPQEIRERRPGPEDWSIDEHLWHMAEAERYYVSAFGVSTDVTASSPDAALRQSGIVVVEAIAAIPESDWSTVRAGANEEWTLAKSLRRMVGHLREHAPWLRELAGPA